MEQLIIKLVENNYGFQLIAIVFMYFVLLKTIKLLRLFLVYYFKNYIDDFKRMKKNSTDYEVFKKDVENKLESLSKKIEEVDLDSKKRSEKNENKIYEIWRK